MYWIFVLYFMLPKNSIANGQGKVWGYDSHLAPEHWGKLHSKIWDLCENGKQQSPIEIDPKYLLFDPNLTKLDLNMAHVNGRLETNGLDITFSIDNDLNLFNITGGPLSYIYTIRDIKFHYGKSGNTGSEHKISNRAFPAEVHLIGYNEEIYKSKSRAEFGTKGVVIVSVFLEAKAKPNYAIDQIVKNLTSMKKSDESSMNIIYEKQLNSIDLSTLLPNTDQYITYEGSFTQPGCQETVTWILFNKPTFISEKQLHLLRRHGKGNWYYNNSRPVQPIHQRVVRTNINFKPKSTVCSMERKVQYKVNSNLHS